MVVKGAVVKQKQREKLSNVWRRKYKNNVWTAKWAKFISRMNTR